MARILLVAALMLLTSSCSLYSVKTEKGWAGRAPGVPFLTRKAVLYQVTKVAQLHWAVTFELEMTPGNGGKSTRWTAPAVPFNVIASLAGEQELRRIENALSSRHFLSPDDFARQVADLLSENPLVWAGCSVSGSSLCIDPVSNRRARLVENRKEVQSVLSTQRYYLNTRMPWIGSSSATVKLASDGTLTDATAEGEDKTVSTILSLIPVTAYLTEVLDLPGSSSNPKANTSKFDFGQTARTSARAVLQGSYWVYTLRAPLKDGAEIAPQGLQYGPGSVSELVGAVEVSTPKSAASEPKTDAWRLSGEVTPPKAK